MNVTPVIVLGIKYPSNKRDIEKLSEKWEKRTKGLDPCWPKGGTFDVSMCEDMGVRIKDYKPKDKSKKRQQKREREQEIVRLFKDEGTNYKGNLKKIYEVLKDKKVKGKQPVKQLISTSVAGLYPTLSGIVRIEGDVELGEDKLAIPKCCSTERKNENSKKSKVLDCYAERDLALKEMVKGRSMVDETGCGPEVERITIQQLEEEIRREHQERVENVGRQAAEDSEGQEQVKGTENESGSEGQTNHAEEQQEVEQRKVVGGSLTFTEETKGTQ